METIITTNNDGGKVRAYDGEVVVGELDFSFCGNVLSINRIQMSGESDRGGGVNTLMFVVSDYAVSHRLLVTSTCPNVAAWYRSHPQYDGLLCKET